MAQSLSFQSPLSARLVNGRIPVGISACLMGDPVRFNGSHKRSRFCTDTLSQYFAFESVCPEVGTGMSTPREPIRLVGSLNDDAVRAVGTVDASVDVTDALRAYGEQKAHEMRHLCGYIFMQKSPSCGLFGVKRYLANGHPEGSARGIYADAFVQANPLLPVEEAGRLNDAVLRENFMTRVFAYHDWQQFAAASISARGLIDFHSRYKYLVMAHSLVHYKSMGRILANLREGNLQTLAQDYFTQLMTALSKPASRKTHTNTLMHLQGYLKHLLNAGDKAELSHLIEQYRTGIVPLIVPLTLLRHHLNHHEDASAYARAQVYLNPHPYELGLRNAL
ncbi:YbgA family protein [Thalassolituus sp. LLYu03]|uniref:YbgA family protein n=1 Tax=Thalassolituus sp. LLYu03 TaxID=3421656 RepID=UPI003D2E5430